jgi:hypothetical protein
MTSFPEDISKKALATSLCHQEPRGCVNPDDNSCEDGCELYVAIAQALLDERERAARIAINRADRHAERCDPECKCANGWHIAIAIRSPDTEKTL